MPTSYKQGSIDRRDERNCKSPETTVLKKKSSKSVKKSFSVWMKLKPGAKTFHDYGKEWKRHKRYTKLKAAETAINTIKRSYYYDLFDYKIIED